MCLQGYFSIGSRQLRSKYLYPEHWGLLCLAEAYAPLKNFRSAHNPRVNLSLKPIEDYGVLVDASQRDSGTHLRLRQTRRS